jgi:biopolymer transport protein ExbD
VVEVLAILIIVLGSTLAMTYSVALDMAKKKEKEQEANSDKTQTEVLDK